MLLTSSFVTLQDTSANPRFDILDEFLPPGVHAFDKSWGSSHTDVAVGPSSVTIIGNHLNSLILVHAIAGNFISTCGLPSSPQYPWGFSLSSPQCSSVPPQEPRLFFSEGQLLRGFSFMELAVGYVTARCSRTSG